MDGQKFDELARLLAGDADRRSVVKRLVAGALAGAFALRGAAAGATGDDDDDGGDDDDDGGGGGSCRGENHPCEGNQSCCAGLTCTPGGGNGAAKRCVKPGTTPGGPGTPCTGGDDCNATCTCTDNVCQQCPSGKKRCGNACIPNGACCNNSECPGSQTCTNGTCGGGTGTCGAGTKPCGTACIPTAQCCANGTPGCPAGQTCSNGTCTGGTTPPPTGGGGGGGTSAFCRRCKRNCNRVCRFNNGGPRTCERECEDRRCKRCKNL